MERGGRGVEKSGARTQWSARLFFLSLSLPLPSSHLALQGQGVAAGVTSSSPVVLQQAQQFNVGQRLSVVADTEGGERREKRVERKSGFKRRGAGRGRHGPRTLARDGADHARVSRGTRCRAGGGWARGASGGWARGEEGSPRTELDGGGAAAARPALPSPPRCPGPGRPQLPFARPGRLLHHPLDPRGGSKGRARTPPGNQLTSS